MTLTAPDTYFDNNILSMMLAAKIFDNPKLIQTSNQMNNIWLQYAMNNCSFKTSFIIVNTFKRTMLDCL